MTEHLVGTLISFMLGISLTWFASRLSEPKRRAANLVFDLSFWAWFLINVLTGGVNVRFAILVNVALLATWVRNAKHDKLRGLRHRRMTYTAFIAGMVAHERQGRPR